MVKDSKLTSAAQRDMMYFPLLQVARDVGIGWSWPWEIDANPSHALQLSYKRAIEGINPSFMPGLLIMDGVNKVEAWHGNQLVEPKADAKYWQVSAASIIAKVYRDTVMKELGRNFPEYGWAKNSGYGTDDHRKAIEEHGLLIDFDNRKRYIHRQRYCKNFKVKQM
jgi:ribonuclease HII